MNAQPLFFAPTSWDKIAGYKLPSNPRQWQAEVIRYLKSAHPYLPLDNSEIQFQRVDVAKGAAVGSVIVNKELAIPIIISRPKPGDDPELAPLDVFFHKDRYWFLDPESVKQLTHSPQVGEAEGRTSRAVGGNPYVGDVTGDATPLEYSGQASPFAGPYDGTKTAGVDDVMTKLIAKMPKSVQHGALGAITGGGYGALRENLKLEEKGKKVSLKERAKALGKGFGKGVIPGAAIGLTVNRAKTWFPKSAADVQAIDIDNGFTAQLLKTATVDVNDLSEFRRLVATMPAAFTGTGANLRLVELVLRAPPSKGLPRTGTRLPNVLQIFNGPNGGIYVKFSGSPEQRTSAEELKKVLGDRYDAAMAKLKNGDVYIEHDGLQQASWSVEGRPSSESKPVMSDGMHQVRMKDGSTVVGFVAKAMMRLDGRHVPMKLFVTHDGKYAVAEELFGTRMSDKNQLPSAKPAGGQTGVFVNYVHGTPIVTTPLQMRSVSVVNANGTQRVVYRVSDPATGEVCTLSPVTGVQGFERMRVVDPGLSAVADGELYFMPADSEWVPLTSRLPVANGVDSLTKVSSDESAEIHVTYGGGLWNIHGTVNKLAFFGPAAAAASGFFRKGVSQVAGAMKNPSSLVKGVKGAYQKGGVGAVAKKYAPGAAVAGGAGLAGYGAYKAVTASDLHHWEARELLVGLGMPADKAQWALDEAKRRDGQDRGIKIAGLVESQLSSYEEITIPEPEYSAETEAFARSCRPSVELLKAAAASGHPDTLDAILSLEFITPQNMRYFIEHLADFDETVSRLAALLIAVRLGLPHVPETPVKDALEGLAKTVNRLKILKSAMDHQNERAATAAT